MIGVCDFCGKKTNNVKRTRYGTSHYIRLIYFDCVKRLGAEIEK